MSAAELTQLITAVTIVPTAFLLGLLVTYFVANIEQLKYKWECRKGGKTWRKL